MDSGLLWFAVQVFFTLTRPDVQHRCGLHVFYGPCVGNLIFRPILFARGGHSTCAIFHTRYRDIELCDYQSWFDDCTSNSNHSSQALLLPCGPTLFPVDVDAICKYWGGVRASVQLVSALLCSVTRYYNEHDDVSKYWEDTPFFLKMNSCDLDVLTALGNDHVNMQLNLHFNGTVAALSFNVSDCCTWSPVYICARHH